jgi:hypothetical protein
MFLEATGVVPNEKTPENPEFFASICLFRAVLYRLSYLSGVR